MNEAANFLSTVNFTKSAKGNQGATSNAALANFSSGLSQSYGRKGFAFLPLRKPFLRLGFKAATVSAEASAVKVQLNGQDARWHDNAGPCKMNNAVALWKPRWKAIMDCWPALRDEVQNARIDSSLAPLTSILSILKHGLSSAVLLLAALVHWLLR